MENAVEALKMAGFMLLFIIALSITMVTLTQAKTTADSLVKSQDRQETYQYIELSEDETRSFSRTVTLSDIIPTLYRYAQEDYAVQFYYANGSPLNDLYESGEKRNGVHVRKNDLDLDTEHWVENGVTRYEEWRGNSAKIKEHVDDVVEYLLANYKDAKFIERLGTTEDYEEKDTNEMVPDVNKQYKRIITYTVKN